MAALTEHYNQIQDRAGDESTGSGVRLRTLYKLIGLPAIDVGILCRCQRVC
jgi:hypothetical protein